jgi:hypothetical protein
MRQRWLADGNSANSSFRGRLVFFLPNFDTAIDNMEVYVYLFYNKYIFCRFPKNRHRSITSISQTLPVSPWQLKGPKREIFGLEIFAQLRPIWIGYLGTRPKNPKKLRLGPYIALYFPRFLC